MGKRRFRVDDLLILLLVPVLFLLGWWIRPMEGWVSVTAIVATAVVLVLSIKFVVLQRARHRLRRINIKDVDVLRWGDLNRWLKEYFEFRGYAIVPGSVSKGQWVAQREGERIWVVTDSWDHGMTEAIMRNLLRTLHEQGVDRGLVVARGFTRAVRMQAEPFPVDLWDRDTLNQLLPAHGGPFACRIEGMRQR